MRQFSLALLLSGIVLAFGVTSTFAQISAGGTPPSFSLALSSTVPTAPIAPVDPVALLAEDEQAPKDVPFRFAAVLDVSLNLNNSGVWEDVPGGRLWRLRISSPGAYSLCLSYDQWNLPEGGQLFLYDDDHWQVIGAFTSFNNWVDGTNITQHVAGDAITVEYFEPVTVQGQGVLSISHVAHAYRNVHGKPNALENFGDSGSCNNNANCPIGYNWQSDKRGATMVELSNGSRLCSGSLITNVAQDQTPYYLTANHCLGSSNTWIFVFNYESPACSNVNGPTSQTVANSTLRASNAASDFGLLQLSSAVPLSYAPYFNGWNNVNIAADSTTVIHHPSGDIKKISFDRNPPVSSTWSGTPANSHWRILAYESGTTEPGSSGSPLFDQNHRIIGQLHGGTASCSNNIDDYYGKFSMSWNYGGSSSTRLRDWLDPGNTHTVMDGYSPVSISITSPNGGESWAVGSVQNITWTSTALSQNVKIELNRAYPTGAWETVTASTANTGSYAWTISGATTTTARVRISGTTSISLNDISDANFSLITSSTPSITVTAPNGGETWFTGESNTITWSSLNLSENVKIDLNRGYPGPTWETLFASTPNDGSQAWTVTSPLSSTARIRITGTVQTTVGDTSNANFTIAGRTITVASPNGGENWLEGSLHNVTWTSANVTGNVTLELNRNYPGGVWESIAPNTANDGSEPWTVTLPASTLVRVRVTAVNFAAVSDVSDNNFTVSALNAPPVIAHDPLDDQFTEAFTATALVTDNAAGVTSKFFYWHVSGGPVDSAVMNATGNPNEVAVTLGPLAPDSYDYYLRAVDAGGLATYTPTFAFEVAAPCGIEYAYDDGTAEQSQWSAGSVDYLWAVRFDPPALPFALCSARLGISALNPSTSHSQILVEVYAADGPGGLPGTPLFADAVGSIGNVIGGVPSSPDNWSTVVFRDAGGNPLSLNGSYYVAVSNPVVGQYEAFLLDQSSAYAGHSFVYEPCNAVWLAENSGDPSARLGNRMIRSSGFPLTPPSVVIHRAGDNIELRWQPTGAPYYRVYSDSTPDGTFATFLGSTSGATFVDVNPLGTAIKFYRVVASTAP